MSETDGAATEVTVRAFQAHIRERYLENDRSRGRAASFVWFIEEVGELATALQGDDPDNLEEELADVFAWLCTLANLAEVDLTAAIRRKYLDRAGEAPEFKS